MVRYAHNIFYLCAASSSTAAAGSSHGAARPAGDTTVDTMEMDLEDGECR